MPATPKQRADAPRHPAAAVSALEASANRLAGVARSIADRVLVPHLGGPGWASALSVYEAELAVAADSIRGQARKAGRRISVHSRREVERLTGVRLPKGTDAEVEFVRTFENNVVAALRKVARDQVLLLRLEGADGEHDLAHKLWVTRTRTPLVARDQSWKLAGAGVQFWAEEAGSPGYYWITRRDERVRPEHAALDGRWFRWDAPPAIGHPGSPINCRCSAHVTPRP